MKFHRFHRYRYHDDDYIENDEVELLIKHLHSQNAFIIDIDYLKHLVDDDDDEYSTDVTFNFDHFKRYIEYSEKESFQIVFGIKSEYVNILSLKSIYKKYGLKCTIERENDNNQVLIHVFIKCLQVTIQITVFHPRGDFLWTRKVGSDTSHRWFGDTDRAVQNFEIGLLTDERSSILFVPKDIRQFLYDYSRSEFLECRQHEYQSSFLYSERDERVLDSLKYLASMLEMLQKNYWLTSGTLLGWHRDCAIIKHTTDIDVAMNAEDYDERIWRLFTGNNRLYTFLTISTINSGFEMRLNDHLFTYDLFFLYKYNRTHRWSAYYVEKMAYKAIYTDVKKLCSAQLGNSKFTIPCAPLDAIVSEYGLDWTQPKEDGYNWANIDEKTSRNLTETEWSNLFKEYDMFGNLKEISFE